MAVPVNTRARILEAAEAAFIAGAGEIEMGEVARRAGVSVGLAYHYFGSKAGLLSALIAGFYDRYDAVVNQSYDKGLSWPDRESRRLRDAVLFLFSDPVAPIMLGKLSGDAKVVATEAARREAVIALAVVNIRRAQERGEIDPQIDPAIAAAVINGGLRQAIAQALTDRGSAEPEALSRQLWRLVAGALGLNAPTA
jgi:AcrR family transcriptional regulator